MLLSEALRAFTRSRSVRLPLLFHFPLPSLPFPMGVIRERLTERSVIVP